MVQKKNTEYNKNLSGSIANLTKIFSKENPEKLKLMINKEQNPYVLETISEIYPLKYLPLLIWSDQIELILMIIAKRVPKEKLQELITNYPGVYDDKIIGYFKSSRLL